MSTRPPQVVIDAIETGNSRVTRHVDFYESDGVTPWYPNDDAAARLVDGSVTLSTTTDERRTLEIKLDNSDNALRPDAIEGLWYDKVIKTYRGVRYFTQATSQLVIATNLAINPSLETNQAQWQARWFGPTGTGTVVRTAGVGRRGSYALRKTWTAVGADADTGFSYQQSVTAGKYYAFRAAVRASKATGMVAYVYWYSDAGFTTLIGSPSALIAAGVSSPATPANTWVEVSGVAQAPATAVAALFMFGAYSNGATPGSPVLNWAIGDTHDGDSVLIAEVPSLASPVPPYFDGTTSRAQWTGAPHASTSQLWQPLNTSETTYWETQLGEFLIDKIEEDNYPHITSTIGRDYTKRCMISKTEKSTSFAQGTNVVTLIKAVAANAGIVKFRLPAGTEVLNTLLAIERGTERWKLMKDVATSYGYEIFFDNEGYLVMRKFLDPSTSALEWTFQTGSQGNLVKWNRSTNDSRLYNHIIVTGEGGAEDALPFFGEAKNEEPSSPTRIKRIGDRSYFYTSSFFTSDQQCKDLANAWLKTKALESYESKWSSFNYPWMEVGEIIGFLDPLRRASEPTRYLMDTLTIPLGLGPMAATAKRVTYVNDPNTDVDDTDVVET